MPQERIILGIDPGTTIMGYGVIRVNGNNPELVALGLLELQKFDDHHARLKKILDRTLGLIDEYHPVEMAIEAPFYEKNIQSMLKLGRAQGVAIAAALSRDLPVFEYAPRKIKQSIVGNGNASKEQVAAMLMKILKFDELPKKLDATDGLAAAVCHFYQKKIDITGPSVKSWKEFMSKNPKKVIAFQPPGKKSGK
ncbi:MAG: crossover junction endodeoxyribonuclease RuvC [Bacteroidia bacterium]|nr:crossover junction endodeoxyribonuclease RuvC [Bacteroidia bacterium]